MSSVFGYRATASGKKVKVEYSGRELLNGTTLPIKEDDVSFTEVGTGEVVMHVKNYYSEGGWLKRYTWIGMGSHGPLLFDGNGCGLKKRDRRFSEFQISVIN